MIYLYSGTPGSGKSLHVARVIRNTLLLDKPVLANIPINTDRIRHSERFIYVPDARLRPSALVEYSQKHFEGKTVKEGEILLIIDEAQRLFNARDWSKSDRAAWNEFFQLHRHFGYDIILVAQFDRMLDRQVRSVIEYEQIHRKVSKLWLAWLASSARSWWRLRSSSRSKCGTRCENVNVGSEFFRYSKRLGRMYDTFMAFPAVEDSEASGVSV